MSSKNTIQVFEHEKLTLQSCKEFEQKHLNALISYNDKFNNQYFTVIRDGVKFNQYVGVIQAGNLTIEILPKADKREANDERSKSIWHSVLLNMLKECHLLKVDHVDKALLNLRSNSLLDIYMELFLNQAEQLLHEGLLKKYRKVQGNQLALKGQLMFAKNINQNLIHQERFYVRYTEYNRNNIFNQIIYKTILLIPQISNSSWLTDKVNRLVLDFPELPDIKVTSTTFEKLVFDRKTERYKEAILISKMLLLNYRPDITGGAENVIAILFDMNKLWEEFVYRRLKREELNFVFQIKRQQSENFWKLESSKHNKTIRPDIVIKVNEETIVLDTKWKIIEDLLPDDDDLKQMYIYNLFWNCNGSILLYPSAKENCVHGDYNDYRKKGEIWTRCTVQTLNILDNENKLDKLLGQRLIEKLIKPASNKTGRNE